MRWIVAIGLLLVALVVFREVPVIGAFDNLLLAVITLLSTIGLLIQRFIPSL
jgi:hypothetical protein